MGALSTPIADLLTRLRYHCRARPANTDADPLRLLEGTNLVEVPTVEVTGMKDLPGIRLINTPFRTGSITSAFTETQITIRLLVATEREVWSDPAIGGIVNHLAFMERVIDACCTQEDGKVRPNLEGMGAAMTFSVGETGSLDSSINSLLIIGVDKAKAFTGNLRKI